jgi:hypothetical protein
MKKFLSLFLCIAFLFTSVVPPSHAQAIFNLPVPGAMVQVSPAYVPTLLRGMTVHPEDPYRFDFILDNGNSKLAASSLKEDSGRLVNYFLAAMTVPQNDLWVNLSPVEHDRIVPEALGRTELGQDLLAQDYILKQLSSSLMYPETGLGKKFWDKVYAEAEAKYGTTEIPTEAFNKVWITPDTATVYEQGAMVYVVDARLKVMLDSDYQAAAGISQAGSPTQELTKDVIREVILPAIEQEVNTGKNFASLRQIYFSLILAKWYKEKVKSSILSQVFIDQNKVRGIDLASPTSKEDIYTRYMEAYTKGVYNYIKEEFDMVKQESIPRKYFSGGFTDKAMAFNRTNKASDVNASVVGDNFKVAVNIAPQSDAAMGMLASKFDWLNRPFKRMPFKTLAKFPLMFALASQPLSTSMFLKVLGPTAVVVVVGCTQDDPIPVDPGVSEQEFRDALQQLSKATSYAGAQSIYRSLGDLWYFGDFMEITKSFIKNSNENSYARTVMFEAIASTVDMDFLLGVMSDQTDLYSSDMKSRAEYCFKMSLTYDLCLKYFNAPPNENTANTLIRILSDQGDFKTLFDASRIASGVLKDQLVTASELVILNGLRARTIRAERLSSDAVPYLMAFAKNTNENTDARKDALNFLGQVGNYNDVVDYLINVILYDESYQWWHKIEAKTGFFYLVLRQPDAVLADTARISDIYKMLFDYVQVRITNTNIYEMPDAIRAAQGLGKIGDQSILVELEALQGSVVNAEFRAAVIQAIADIKARLGLKSTTIDKASLNKVGGIDMNNININQKSEGSSILFDLKNAVSGRNIGGFKPVIINITPINSPLAI